MISIPYKNWHIIVSTSFNGDAQPTPVMLDDPNRSPLSCQIAVLLAGDDQRRLIESDIDTMPLVLDEQLEEGTATGRHSFLIGSPFDSAPPWIQREKYFL
jgi:hypothetical protein